MPRQRFNGISSLLDQQPCISMKPSSRPVLRASPTKMTSYLLQKPFRRACQTLPPSMLLKKKGLSADLSLLEQPILVIKVKFWYSTLRNCLAQHHSLLCTIIISTERQGFKARSNHPLLEAFTEYNRLVKARYLLSYIDDSELHSHVQKALNRGEAYHQLRRAISQVNGDRY